MDKKQRRLMLNRKAAQEVRRGFIFFWVRQTYVCGPCRYRRLTLDRCGRSFRRSDRARRWSERTQFLNPLPVRSTQTPSTMRARTPQSRLRKKAKAQQLAQQLEGMKAENSALADENEAMRRVRACVVLRV